MNEEYNDSSNLVDDSLGAGPSRAKAIGSGRVTGPGEGIADSAKWMRWAFTFFIQMIPVEMRSLISGPRLLRLSISGVMERTFWRIKW